jgi:hypothetical protein
LTTYWQLTCGEHTLFDPLNQQTLMLFVNEQESYVMIDFTPLSTHFMVLNNI